LKAAYVDQGPTKNRRRMRPAPQGRAYRERRHFCHVTVLVSSDKQDTSKKGDGKADETKPAVSKRAKRGGAAAAPRAKRGASKAEVVETSAAEEKPQKKASKAASKLGSALRRKKKTDE
jgi:hypothetical protein